MPLVEMTAILSDDHHTNMIREPYFDHTVTKFSAKYILDNKVSLDHGRLSCVSLYSLSNLIVGLNLSHFDGSPSTTNYYKRASSC